MENARRNAKTDRLSAATETPTRETILAVAENQFAVAGYDGASVRDIQRAANANGGAVFYYFGTKQALYEAVFERLVVPLVEERMRRLAICVGGSTPPTLEQILAAYLEPGLKDGFDSAQHRWNFAQIRAQLMQTHHGFMKEMLTRHFTRTGLAFLSALGQALPDLDPRDLQWRYHTMVGAVTFAMGGTERLRLGDMADKGPMYDPGDTDETFRQMVILMASMFRAPPGFSPAQG